MHPTPEKSDWKIMPTTAVLSEDLFIPRHNFWQMQEGDLSEAKWILRANQRLSCRLTPSAKRLLRKQAGWVFPTIKRARGRVQKPKNADWITLLTSDSDLPDGYSYNRMTRTEWNEFVGAALRLDAAQLEVCRQTWLAFALQNDLWTSPAFAEPLTIGKLAKVGNRIGTAEEIKDLSREARQLQLIS